MEYIFNFVQTVWEYPKVLPIHPDAARGRQRCKHCKQDPSELWSPTTSHNYRSCLRRAEPLNGGRWVTKYYLHCGSGIIEVCAPFWRNTFGICKKVQQRLGKYSSSAHLPPEAFTWGGSAKSNREALVLQYVQSVPRHYSHFSTSSTREYVDCASSGLNWWKGPTEVNDDGTVSPCFLEWLDEKNGTEHHQFFRRYGWWPGVCDLTRANKPLALCGSTGLEIPRPAVSYKYFMSVIGRFVSHRSALIGVLQLLINPPHYPPPKVPISVQGHVCGPVCYMHQNARKHSKC